MGELPPSSAPSLLKMLVSGWFLRAVLPRRRSLRFIASRHVGALFQTFNSWPSGCSLSTQRRGFPRCRSSAVHIRFPPSRRGRSCEMCSSASTDNSPCQPASSLHSSGNRETTPAAPRSKTAFCNSSRPESQHHQTVWPPGMSGTSIVTLHFPSPPCATT